MKISGCEDENLMNEKQDFWDNIYGIKMPSIKRWVLHEPIVDIIPSKQIITSESIICEIDLNTCKPSDANFASKYYLEVYYDSFFQTIVAWFEATFSKCHVPVLLSTSPYKKTTHWK